MSDNVSFASAPPREFFEPVSRRVVPANRYYINVLLFLMTIFTTLFWGAFMMIGQESVGSVDFSAFVRQIAFHPALLQKGIAYSFSILLILLSHEMGHYLACRFYGINATLPFFIPAPVMTGTFGAFIRIRSHFPNKKSLFDVGLAGPIAGFVMLLPFLYFGLKLSTQIPISQVPANAMHFGDPLILRIFASFLIKPGYDTYLHPMAFAAWFACLATSLNLLPIAQLDGGHVSYALFGKRAYKITWIFFGGVIGLAVYAFATAGMAGIQWVFYSILLLVLRKIAGFRHPPTLDDESPVGFWRKVWGVIALIVFILTFVPVTIIS